MLAVEILPALMPKSVAELEEKLALVKGLVSYVQLDVMDGIFVPNTSFPYVGRGIMEVPEALPYWENFDFEFDLMVKDPEKELARFFELGARRIVLHFESADRESLLSAIGAAKELEVEVGMALDNTTPLSALEEFISKVDFVQVMGIARIGFQGEPFDERAIARLSELRERHPDLILSVDGSVNAETASRLIAAGATRLVAGSAIFESDDVEEAIKELEQS